MRTVVLCSFFLLLFLSGAFADVSPDEQEQVQSTLTSLENALSKKDVEFILGLLPSDAAELRQEIDAALRGKDITIRQSIRSYEDLGNDQVRVKTRFSAAGPGWKANGFSNYYVLEKSGEQWLIRDTNFHEKLGPGYVFRTIGKVLLIIFVIAIPFGLFWLWMLIDAARRQFDNKALWILLIVLTGIIGAVVYFFVKRRELVRASDAARSGKRKRTSLTAGTGVK